MRRRGISVAVLVVILSAYITTRGHHRAPAKRDVPPPDTAVAGLYGATLPAADSPGRTVTLKLTGFMTARMEADYGNGQAPVVDTGAWTKDDAGAIVVTFAPRDTATGSGDTLRFDARGDSLVTVGQAYGSAGLTLVRTR